MINASWITSCHFASPQNFLVMESSGIKCLRQSAHSLFDIVWETFSLCSLWRHWVRLAYALGLEWLEVDHLGTFPWRTCVVCEQPPLPHLLHYWCWRWHQWSLVPFNEVKKYLPVRLKWEEGNQWFGRRDRKMQISECRAPAEHLMGRRA